VHDLLKVPTIADESFGCIKEYAFFRQHRAQFREEILLPA
jgi:hypothetical protein